jgi:hypothetical protein
LGAFLVFNMIAVMLIVYTGLNVYVHGWAFEVFLFAGFLAAIAWGVQKAGVLIPAILFLGNAIILTYFALTGRWLDWLFMWMLEPVVLAIAIVLPRNIMKRPDAEPTTRAASMSLAVLALTLAGCTFSLGLIVNLFR